MHMADKVCDAKKLHLNWVWILFFLKSNQINKVILNTKKNKESKAEQWCESIGWGQLRQTTFR